jgi:hypothetical protein
VIPELRTEFNARFKGAAYRELQQVLAERCGGPIPFRVAETPIFVTKVLLDEMAELGTAMAEFLLGDRDYLAKARLAIPEGYEVVGESAHPNFLTADFALVRTGTGDLAPRLVEIQAFPSVFGYQMELCGAYRTVFQVRESLGTLLGGLDEPAYWELLGRTILGRFEPEQVVLSEVDPLHQKTFPDFEVTRRRLGISIVDIASIEADRNRLYRRDESGRRVEVDRIYDRAIVDELIARKVKLRFDLSQEWDVEWAGHPNWYFLLSKYSIPFLARSGRFGAVPPACFLDEFLAGPGEEFLAGCGVDLRRGDEGGYSELLLKPIFSFAGKGIEFSPSRARLEAISPEERKGYIVQQRMHFEPTIQTPFGLTQAEIRILYLWPDGGQLTPTLSLVRLGRGKMMGVDHNKDQEWVGGSAAFYV